jgi:hypothetical protein
MKERQRRVVVILLSMVIVAAGAGYQAYLDQHSKPQVQSVATAVAGSPALDALTALPIKGKAPKTGYTREQFSNGWGSAVGCDVRNFILKRDMTGVITTSEADCTVQQGTLLDPYTLKTIMFVRGTNSSDDVQIDHVVALSNAWQTGAQQISPELRHNLANDPLNLLAVDGPTNQKKSDADAATWLPPNKNYRCQYVARQVAVKKKYTLWVTQPEFDAIKQVLAGCPDQILPIVS